MAPRRKNKKAAAAGAEEDTAEVDVVRPNHLAPPTEEAVWKNPTTEDKTLRKLVKDGLLLD